MPPGFRSEEGWRTSLRDTANGTRIEALTREDRAIAKEIGKAMIRDDDYKWHWRVVENWNKDKEEEIMEQLKILDMEDKEYVLVPNDFYGEDDDLDDCSPRRGWEWNKGAGIPAMIRDKMAKIDNEKDTSDEEMMKEMARFESETRLHLLRSTPPEDRIIPFSEQVDCEYQGWIRSVYEDVQILYGSSDWGRDYGSVYMKERIRRKAEIIRKPK